tara:strand:+ start:4131 stop:4985 length:855 start_codon:yes stop_codon:yes gene_type:complete
MSEEAQAGSVVTGSSEAPDAAPQADWKASLPEDLRSDPSLADIKDVENLTKSFINGQKLIGKDKIALPGKEATETEMSDFYAALGRPEEAKGYDFGERPKMPEGVTYDENFETQFRDIAFQAGLTPQQAKTIYDGYHEYVNNSYATDAETSQLQHSEWIDGLKKEFGKAYNERVDLAQRAVETYGTPELKEWLEGTGMGNNPMFVRLFAKVGEGLAEGKPDTGADRSFIMTPDQARQEIARFNRDPEFMKAYQNGDNPNHSEAVEKMNALFKLAYPDETPVQPA